ncbi:AGAP008511-PA-like protein [Anopheles sinensis]|uniref:AGAP008511-PA-like protein n=1 Tax=Anopheles sinensis TaxID=74873 RepID=A0A084VNL8_ANOSI|nr:AGAP008511-PA-like protein [Anopheles sinensis]
MYQNFTFDIVEPSKPQMGSGDAVVDEIKRKQGDMGLAGIFVTNERNLATEMSVSHSTDCAAFLTLMSSALPRYRAILGPFQWPVWVAIIFIYLLAIFPLAFSDKMTLRHLLGNWSEIENMFWYVFGTFTNSLTFQGENSWSNTKKASTRMLIGIYWLFTIIITACYTGSIIAFITLPVEPERVDSVEQLNRGFYRIGTLDRGGWERWFTNKRYGLHVSRECFALYGVSIAFPPNSVHRDPINNALLYMQEAGLIKKLSRDVTWDTVKTKDGRFREASVGDVLRSTAPEERGLTLADTEGMFLLMLFGYVVALGVLISEWVGGCTNKCREILKERAERLKAAAAGDDASSVPRSTISSANESTPRKGSGRNGGREFTLSGDTSLRTARRIQLTKEQPNDVNETGSDGRSDCSSVHKRSLSECLSEVSSHTMQDLYNGPDRRHSTIVFIEGQLMSEEEAQRTVARNKGKHRHSLNSVVEREVGQMFKFLDSGSSVSGEENSGLKHRGPRDRNDVEVMAEINARALGDTGNASTVGRRSIEASFGEKLLH